MALSALSLVRLPKIHNNLCTAVSPVGFTLRSLAIVLLISFLASLSCSQAGLGVSYQGWGGPSISGNSIYLPSKKGGESASVHSINSVTGGIEGTFNAGGELTAIYGTPTTIDSVTSPLTVITSIYTSNDKQYGRVYAFRNGDLSSPVWQFPEIGQDIIGLIFGGVAYSPTNNAIYFGSSDGYLYGLKVDSGKPLVGGGVNDGAFGRVYDTAFLRNKQSTGKKRDYEEIWSTPAVEGGIVYFGTMEGTLVGVPVGGGMPTLAFEAKGAITATPLVESNVVYVGSFDKHFYAVPTGLLNPNPIWKLKTDNWIWSEAILAPDQRGQDVLFITSLDGKVYGVDAGTGSLIWAKPFTASEGIRGKPALVNKNFTGGQYSSLADKVLVVGSRDGMVYGLDPISGTSAWETPINVRDKVLAQVSARNNIAYVVNANYDLFAIDVSTGKIMPNFVRPQ